MSRFKRVLGLSFLAGMLSALALAVPAQANTVKADCLAVGTAKVVDKLDPTLGVRKLGGAGYYTFRSLNLVCAGLVKGAPAVTVLDVNSYGYYHNIVCGTGIANNNKGVNPIVPGHNGGNTLNSVVADTSGKPTTFWAAFVPNIKYSVEFVATVGQFFVDQADSVLVAGIRPKDINLKQQKPLSGDPKNPNGKSTYDLAGAVVLSLKPDVTKVPTVKSPLDDLTQKNCVRGFSVVANFKLDL